MTTQTDPPQPKPSTKLQPDKNQSTEIGPFEQKLKIMKGGALHAPSNQTVALCKKCIKKDSQIAYLKKCIKDMAEKAKGAEQEIYCQEMGKQMDQKDVQLSEVNEELQILKKKYEQLKGKFSQSLNTEDRVKKVSQSELSKSQYRNQILEEQNSSLKAKIIDLQQQLSYMQTSTKIVGQTTTSTTKAPRPTSSIPFSPIQNPTKKYQRLELDPSISTPPLVSTTPYLPSLSVDNTNNYTYRLPFSLTDRKLGRISNARFNYLQNSAINHNNNSYSYSNNNTRKPVEISTHLEYLTHSRDPYIDYRNGYQKISCDCPYLSNPVSSRYRINSSPNHVIYSRDISEERWNNLNYKIQMLENENWRIRAKMIPLSQ